MRNRTSKATHRPLLSWVYLLTVLLFWALVSAAVPAQTDAASTAPTPSAGQQESDRGKCVQGCQRWGKFCNIDPRGERKCRRRCEKFGEICE